jgi:hypothetical protein
MKKLPKTIYVSQINPGKSGEYLFADESPESHVEEVQSSVVAGVYVLQKTVEIKNTTTVLDKNKKP